MALTAKCSFDDCDYTVTVESRADWDEAWKDHLEWHLVEYFDREVEAGRAVRIERPGESVKYRMLAEPTPPTQD